MDDGPLTEDEQRRINELLNRWLDRCRVALAAYNDATTRTVAAERRLGVPAVVLTALVATGVFATLERNPGLGWRIATGVVAVSAAVLMALQTFLRQEERAEQFREAARSYGRLRRRIEQATLFPPSTKGEASALLDEVAKALAEAALGKPNVPQAIWNRAEYKVKGRSDAQGLQALRLRLRDRLDFGVGPRRREPLVEDHERYFSGLEKAIVVPVTRVRPATTDDPQVASVMNARRRMQEAAAGKRKRRPPVDVLEDGVGGYLLVDGNATFAVAKEDGWETVPVRLVNPP